VLLDAQPFRIIGVMPPGFGFPHTTDVMDAAKVTDIWIPWAMTAEQKSNRNDSAGNAIGRLRQGVSLEQAHSEMSTLMAKIDLLRPVKDRGFGALVHPFVASVTGAPRRALLLLMGAVTLLLLIACSNVASLAMARATGRIHGETLSWLTVEGYPFDEKVFFQTRSVTPHYFAALGIRLLEGQSFTNDDCNGHPLV